jgi:hypothetical protein
LAPAGKLTRIGKRFQKHAANCTDAAAFACMRARRAIAATRQWLSLSARGSFRQNSN